MPVLEEHLHVDRRVGAFTRRLASRRRSSKTRIAIVVGVVLIVVAALVAYPRVREEIAYSRGMQAYVYGFPLVMMDMTSGAITAVPTAGEDHAPINQLFRMRTPVSPDYKDVGRMSRSSLWSGGVLDLDKEPLVFFHPDTDGRYIVIQLLNMWTDVFASVGSRTTGTGSGTFLIAGPKWNGTPPPDINNVYRCSTRFAWVLIQIVPTGPQDFSAINALQDQLKVTPLSAWGTPYTPPDNIPVDPNVDTTALPYEQVRLMDAGHFFRRLATLMKDDPPYAADAAMVEKLKDLGIEPGKEFDINKADSAVAKGLNRVPQAVWSAFQSAPYQIKTVNGWILPMNLGRYGVDYDTRGLSAWLGLGALTSEDEVYPSAFADSDGHELYGDSKYVIHFDKDELPPSHSGVWSISAYRESFYVRNPIDRYAIGAGMPLRYNSDGSLDVYIERSSPGAGKESNWLPSPPSGPFNLTVRVYQPEQAMLDGRAKHHFVVKAGTYQLPPVQKVR